MQKFMILGKLTIYPKNPPGIEALDLELSFLTATKLPSYPRTELVKFEK
jgi:hypothetical protein